MIILAADIGGTKSNLAIYDCDLSKGADMAISCAKPIFELTLVSKEFPSPVELVAEFLKRAEVLSSQVQSACFGIAAPVTGDLIETPNLPWKIRISEVQSRTGIKKLSMINDLEAAGLAISLLGPDQLVSLNKGVIRQGHAALLAAGTGLGQAFLFWNGREHQVVACEGGHSDLAARNELELEFVSYLIKKYSRASCERALSGPGLFNIYSFLKESGKFSEPEWLKLELSKGDVSATIAGLALSAKSEICSKALDMFCEIYAAEAGNIALRSMALNGVYLGGGIAPKILERLKSMDFPSTFSAKGPLSNVVKEIPVWVILNSKSALLGAYRKACYQVQ